ncbi:recombinase family protein [Streptomyces sp. NBC_01310]|uniref:recombinase family protein n=1 Tax=Streptomyces sp. NBC_01310 TaxID=2903820 RepID=UPI0035B580FD|nr:recombinase family protein [Streptomyces sp. NBC_01310]WSJ63827.1 recombinase family protein [Streptomyces sp. NBC_01310]
MAVERHDCPNCDAPAGSACRTRGGKTAAKYHTPRFVLVPALREELEIPVPADRAPGRAWQQGPALAVVPAPCTERPIRIGYARTPTARQELASQLEALHRAECHKVFKEQISTRVKVRPELEKALALARQFKEAAPDTPVIFTVHELKRLARNAAELMTLSAELQAGGIQLELLTGPLTGIYEPNGMGVMFFAVLAVAGADRAQLQLREDPRRPGDCGNHGGAAEGHRRRHAHLRPRTGPQGRPAVQPTRRAVDRTGACPGLRTPHPPHCEPQVQNPSHLRLWCPRGPGRPGEDLRCRRASSGLVQPPLVGPTGPS